MAAYSWARSTAVSEGLIESTNFHASSASAQPSICLIVLAQATWCYAWGLVMSIEGF
jgi:hypothetical protein